MLLKIILAFIISTLFIYITQRAFFSERKEISKQGRYLSFILSLIIYIMLIFLIINPAFVFSKKESFQKELNIYIDNSYSMENIYTKDFIEKEVNNLLPEIKEKVNLYTFSYYVSENSNLSFDKAKSDANSLYAHILNEGNDKAHLIISDGIFNEVKVGTNVKLYTVCPERETENISIIPEDNFETLLEGKSVSLKYAVILSEKIREKKDLYDIKLYENGKVIYKASKRFNELYNSFQINYTPKKEGDTILKCTVSKDKDEKNILDNANFRRVFIKKNKTKVLILAGSPSKDFAMLKNFIEKEESLNQDAYYINPKSEKININFSEYDIFVFVNPSKELKKIVYEKGRRYILSGTPYFVMYSESDEYVSEYKSLFPFVEKVYASYNLKPVQSETPYHKLSYAYNANEQIWNSFTFFERFFVLPKNFASPLIKANERTVFAYKKYGSGRGLYFGIAPFYRLYMYGYTMNLDEYYEVFWANVIENLKKKKTENGNFLFDKNSYAISENIKVFLPFNTKGKSINVFYSENQNEEKEIIYENKALQISKRHNYKISFKENEDYIIIQAKNEGVINFKKSISDLKQNERICINPSVNELRNALRGAEIMKTLAKESKGQYYERLHKDILKDIEMKTKESEQKDIFRFSESFVYFVILLILTLIYFGVKKYYGFS